LAFKKNIDYNINLKSITMKKRLHKLILFLIPALLFASCTKDKYSEKDALDAQQKIDLIVTVVDASSSAAPLAGATVKVVIDSNLVSQTTNADGVTVFTNVPIGGDVAVTVTKENFTSVFRTVYTNPDDYRQKQVSAIIGVYSKDAAKMATFKGRLTLESDLTNRKREPAAAVVVKAKNSQLAYADQLFTATTDADGKYEISVPVSTNGNDIELIYPEFVVNQKLAFVQENGTNAVAERPVLYKSDYNPTFSIPSIPSAYATIPAPATTGMGSGFTLGTKANRVALSSYSTALIINGGAGYNAGVTLLNYQLSFSPDKNGVSAKLQVDIVNGKITNIDAFVDNGATYDAPPTLNVSVLSPTTPANIGFYFRTSYKLFIATKGTNYSSVYPLVSVEANNYSNYVKYKVVDANINDNSNTILGYSYLLDNYTAIVAGSIVSDVGNADTLLTATSPLASAPVFSVVEPSTKKAIISISTSSISSTDSTLNSISVINSGLGYDPLNPPAVTITTLASYGSGAVAKSTVNISSSLNNVLVTNPGKKYVQNVNDFRKNGTTSSTSDNPSHPNTEYYGIRAGDITVQDVYYGTGYQIINQNQAK
jgi:hypothetical protein